MMALRSSTTERMGIPGQPSAPVRTSTSMKPRSTGEVAQSVRGTPAENGRRRAGARSGYASPGARRKTETRGASHVMRDQLENGTPRLDLNHGRSGGNGDGIELGAQSLQREAVAGGYPRDQRRRCLGPISLGTAGVQSGGTLRDETLERAVGVGPGESSRTRDSVSGSWAARQEHFVHETFGGGEAEGGEVYPGHTSSMAGYSQ